jgi:two-component system nitrogen regulation response regulator NtrX
MNVDELSFQKKNRFLVVDDEQDIREILCALLEDFADNIDQASNGHEAIELINTNNYDLILSDQRMPIKTGLEVLQWMKENQIDIPFIIQTGYEQNDVLKRARELGVFAFLGKPWEEDVLLDVVKSALTKNN